MVDAQSSFYGELVAQGIPKEDARYVIGQGVASKIIVTMNARELLNFFEHRICHRAQWEIQLLAQRMLELVEPLAPTVFELAGPECVRSKCSEGKMGCGRPYPRKVVA
jgi:thymidylate synthase (FAD)